MTDFPQIDELIVNDPNYVGLAKTKRVCDLFNELAIYIGSRKPMTPDPAKLIFIKKHAVFENYIYIPDGNWIYEIGAFSYSYAFTNDVKIGRYCSIAEGLSILGERHPIEHVTTSNFTYCFTEHWNKPNFRQAHSELFDDRYPAEVPDRLFAPIPLIENDVWIGGDVHLARGIKIGSGAIVAAGSVVPKDVAPYTIVGGNPARLIRDRFKPEISARLLKSRWWDYHPEILFEFDHKNPEKFMDQFDEALKQGMLREAPIRRFDWKAFLELVAGREAEISNGPSIG